jgi:hypothetical protein
VKQSDEFQNFDRTMHDLISVPHSEIKAALDAEKAAKKRKKTLKSEEQADSLARIRKDK